MEKQEALTLNVEKKYIKSAKVCELLDISKTTFWRLISRDPSFPKAINLISTVKVWDRKEVLEWMEAKKAERSL